jgi:hypothetical protein
MLETAVLNLFIDRWQQLLPVLAASGLAGWAAAFSASVGTTASVVALHLPVYMLHQIEEHLRPGGFRQFANAEIFHSGRADWPVTVGGVCFVNTAFVWLPIGLAALFPDTLAWLGFAYVGLSFANALLHLAGVARLRIYNPGAATALLLLLPFSVFVFWTRMGLGELTGAGVAASILAGVLLHGPVAALFVVPWLRARARHKDA